MEPFSAKIVAPLAFLPHDERRRMLIEAGYNPSLLPASAVAFDLLTDSGQGAISALQLSALLTGDEAYAGSADFFGLSQVVEDLLGFPCVVPVHQGRGAENVLCRVLLRPGGHVLANAPFETTAAHVRRNGGTVLDLVGPATGPFEGDFDLDRLDGDRSGVAFVLAGLTCNARGGRPVSLANLASVSRWCQERQVPLVVDGSRVFENAALIARLEPPWLDRPIGEIVRAIADCAEVFYMSGKKDGLSAIGGFLAVRDEALYERLLPHVLRFEGMPTYGGMAGRDMGALAQGLLEASSDRLQAHRLDQIARVADRLRAAGVPFVDPPGGHCVVLDADGFVPGDSLAGCSVSAALYEAAGIRAAAQVPDAGLVRLAFPRRVLSDDQLAFVADAVVHVFERRSGIVRLAIAAAPPNRAETRFAVRPGSASGAIDLTVPAALRPFVNRVITNLPDLSRSEREAALARAHFNVNWLEASAVAIDLFTDSGTNAMSTRQWSSLFTASEAVRGGPPLAALEAAISDRYGMPLSLVAHQGRGAEAIWIEAIVRPGQRVAANMDFFTTSQHLARVEARFEDVSIAQARDPDADMAFKGDVDLDRLEIVLAGGDVAAVCVGLTLNNAGGQPVSLANLEAVSARCRRARVPLWLDATRMAENSWFVREAERPGASLAAIVRQLADRSDGLWVSAKKDALVNIGGFLAWRDERLSQRFFELQAVYEGLPGTGGLAGRDLAFMAQGLEEMVDERYMAHRIAQVRKLWERCAAAGLPVVRPAGGHCVLVDATRMLSHLPPAGTGHALAGALFVASGLRAMPIVSAFGGHEMLRLTVPRRVYSDAQLALAAEALIALAADSSAIPAVRCLTPDQELAYVTGRFQPIPPAIRKIQP